MNEENKIYLMYTKNSSKPVHVFYAGDDNAAVREFRNHPQAKYCKLTSITEETLETIKTGAQVELNRIQGLLISMNDNMLVL